MAINLWEILRKHYPTGEYALMQEVRNGAGHYANRSADYMVFNLWPSRGLSLTGIEVKSYRGDWLREMKQPAKAEAFFKYCDYWWLLVTDESVAKVEELPETWGFMCVKNDKIKVLKQAPKLQPATLDRGIIASMIKRCSDGMIPASSMNDEIDKRVEARIEQDKKHSRNDLESIKKQYNELLQRVNDYEQASGIQINGRYRDVKKIGATVAYLNKGKYADSFEKHLDSTHTHLTHLLDEVKRVQDEMRQSPVPSIEKHFTVQ